MATIQDTLKKAASLGSKLNSLFVLRAQKIEYARNKIASLDAGTTKDTWVTYLEALQQCGMELKNFVTDESQEAALTSLVVANYSWPSKPAE